MIGLVSTAQGQLSTEQVTSLEKVCVIEYPPYIRELVIPLANKLLEVTHVQWTQLMLLATLVNNNEKPVKPEFISIISSSQEFWQMLNSTGRRLV